MIFGLAGDYAQREQLIMLVIDHPKLLSCKSHGEGVINWDKVTCLIDILRSFFIPLLSERFSFQFYPSGIMHEPV